MTPSAEGNEIRNQYRTVAAHQMDPRRLLLRGGDYDGRTWTGVVAVGQRVFCGDGEWSTAGVYLVSDVVELGVDGQPMNIARPAFAVSPASQD